MKIPPPTAEILNELLRYEPDTGFLFWRKRPIEFFSDGVRTAEHNQNAWNARYAEKQGFTAIGRDGYLRGRVFAKLYLAHRVIWCIKTGDWPNSQIDHINHDRADNRFENLREATNSQNSKNLSIFSNNTSGHTGVSFDKSTNKWRARIGLERKLTFLGYFENLDEAVAARKEAEQAMGFHPNHGK